MIIQDRSAADFLAQASEFLYANEAMNSLMLGLAEGLLTAPSLLSSEPPLFLRWVEDNRTLAAVTRTPPVNVVISSATAKQINEFAGYIHAMHPDIPGVVGPSESAEPFAAEWCLLSGKKPHLGMSSLVYEATQIEIPNAVSGQMRSFREDELPLYLRWTREFAREAVPTDLRSEENWRKSCERALSNGTAFAWLIDDEPVSMACLARPTENTVTINSVFTPKHLRGKGYASALVARLSAKMLQNKKSCVLYTDTANGTSNKIYQKIGYRQVGDSKLVHFA